MATHRKEMDVEYFASHPRAGHGGAGSRVPSAHDQGSFTTIPPAATRYGSLDCDLYTRNTRQSHAHKVFDGRSRVSLRHGPSSMTQGSWENNMEKSSQPSRRCHGTARSHGHQVFECRRVSVAAQEMYHSYGNHAHAESQSETQPRVDVSATYQVLDNMPHIHKRVLSVKIHNMAYAVTSDVLYQVFTAYGAVEMVIPTTSSTVLIQYQHEQMAGKAQMLLHGRYLYQSCCQLDIRYAHAAELEMLHPSKCTVQPLLDSSNTSEEKYATVVPNPRVADKHCPQVFDHSPPTSLNQEVSTEKQQHVTLDTIITFLDEWRAEIEQRERSRTEQAELKSELQYFLYHAFDIFEEESESEVVLKIERKNKRIEQEELERELDYFLYQAFDLFGEELKSVLEKENEKILVKHGASTVVGLVCGAGVSTKCEAPQEYLKLYSQPGSDSASKVDFSLNHIIAKQLLNQKLNHVEPRLHWEPGDQEEGNKLMKLTVDSQFLRRVEILGIPMLQLNKYYQSGILELSARLELHTSCSERSLHWKLKESSFCSYMSGGGDSEKQMLPWDPGEQENVFIIAKLKGGSRSAKVTRKCMLINLLELMQPPLLQHSGSLSQASENVKDTIQGSISRLEATQFNCILALLSKLHDTFMYAPITSKEAKMARMEYNVSATTSTAPAKSEKAFTVLVLRITVMGSVSRGNCSILAQARISSNLTVLVLICQEDNWGTSFTQALSLSETKGTCAVIAVAFMRREVMLNVYSLEVLVRALLFPTTSVRQLWTKRLHSDLTILFLEALSGFLAAHILAIDAHISEKFKEQNSNIGSSRKQNQPDIYFYNQWDPGILDLGISASDCKVMDIFHQICHCTMVAIDCSNVQILKHGSYGEVRILDVYNISRQMCVTQCAASNYFGLSLEKDSGFSRWDFLLQIRTNWQWDHCTVTSCHAVLKQSIWSMDLHLEFYQSILTPESEYFWQSTALSSVDSSMQVHNGFSWSKLSVEIKIEWYWYVGSVASSHSVLKLKICSRPTQTSQMQVMTSRLYCTDKVFMADNSWRNTSVAAVRKQRSLKLRSCSCDHHSSYETNQVSFCTAIPEILHALWN